MVTAKIDKYNKFLRISQAKRANFHEFHGDGGFTLLEMIISIGLFSVLVVSSIGITLGVSKAQQKASNVQDVQDNIRFSLELITKEMRTGTNYALTSICAGAGSEISFTTALGEQRTYFLNSSTKMIMRAKEIITGADCANTNKALPFTAEEVTVDHFRFTLRGQAAGPNDGQPMVTISAKTSSKGALFGPETNMNLQTTVVQRLREL